MSNSNLLGQRERRRSPDALGPRVVRLERLPGRPLSEIAFITAGVMTIRNGHLVLFILGLIFPLLWIIGAFIDKPRY